MAPTQVVEARPIREPRYGLVPVAEVVDDPAFRFDGYTWVPETCPVSGRLAIGCEGNTEAIDVARPPGAVAGHAFLVWGGEQCSTIGMRGLDLVGRSRRALDAVLSYEVAAELWGGELTGEATGGGVAGEGMFLASDNADTITTAEASPVAALACVEQALARAGKGQPGMVHMTPQVLAVLVAANALVRDGQLWRTAMGNAVVADGGYDGTGPGGVAAGATQWIYGTDPVVVRRGPVIITPGSLDESDELLAAMAFRVNTVVVQAARPVAVEWDRCRHFAAEVDLAMCGGPEG